MACEESLEVSEALPPNALQQQQQLLRISWSSSEET
jgi:hypothetical protein